MTTDNTQKPTISLVEKVDLVFRLLAIAPLRHAIHFTRSLFIAYWRGLPLRLHIRCALWRTILTCFPPRQLQVIAPTFPETYQNWTLGKLAKASKKNDQFALSRLRCDVEVLGTASISWIGDRANAEKFVLFFHGGGYISPITPGHLEWCYQAYVVGGADIKVNCAVAVLHYTLAPAAIYPTQLKQAVTALKHMLLSGIEPSDIIIGGDSAGGNLALQVIGHVLHPHPGVEPLKLSKPLTGAFTVSPWLSCRTNTSSYKQNGNIDMLSPGMMGKYTAWAFGGGAFESQVAEDDGWAMSLEVAGSWFDGLGTVTRKLYVTAGKQEIFRDHVIRFAESVRSHNSEVEVGLEVAEAEAHDFILVEADLGIIGDAMLRMKAWFQSIVGAQP